MRSSLFSSFLAFCAFGAGARAYVSYANDFVNPDFVIARVFGNNTAAAQSTILQWATSSASGGPWSVTQKNITAPSGNLHDYMSWAPYWWPDCSNVDNTTELTPEEIWKECNYVVRDGKFNPDARLINDVGNFQSLSDMVFYNSLAYAITRTSSSNSYSQLLVQYIKTWFLDPDTMMNPNLNYGQMQRGPSGQFGSHTGILDLKSMTKVVTGIEILRKANCSDWTSDLDAQMNAWTTEYIAWLESATISLEEEAAPNNHGTFFYNQLAALKILIGDNEGALNVTNTYFAEQYMSQITSTGEQPLEAVRTRPYHYHAYNLAAMITNARISAYVGNASVWNKTTNSGATIKTALDFAMTLNASASGEANYASELYPNVAAVGATYGDPDGKYAAFLAAADPAYATEAYFLWNQPLAGGVADSTNIQASGTGTAASGATATIGSKVKANGAALHMMNWVLGACIIAGLQYTFVL